MPLNLFEKPVFVPAVDDWLVVQLPGERTRAVVRKVPDDDSVIVELVVQPMNTRIHRYRKLDLVACRRKYTGMEEIWEAVDEAQLAMAAALKRLETPADEPDTSPVPASTQPPHVKDPHAPPPPKSPPQETENAARAGRQPDGDQPQHRGDDPQRPPKETGHRRRTEQRQAASKR